ncbi:MAG: GtrA family protein [Clostridia bacterium]
MNKTKKLMKELFTMIRYGFVGIINTTVTGLIFLGLRLLHFSYPLYTFIGYSVGITVSFFLNRHFTFRKRNADIKKQALMFFAVTASLLLLTMLLQYILIDLIGISETIGVITGMLFYTVMGYLINRNVVFRYTKE